jgi:microcystin-dependent protein
MALLGAQFVNAVSPNPVGSLQAYAGASAPTGWLLCDGTSYSTSVYPELFSVLGYTYGGSGANFNVPDLRGRVPMGAGTGTGLNASGTGAPSGTAQTARTRGQWGGEETHLLTGAESGTSAHNHGITDPGHSHTFGVYGGNFPGGAAPASLFTGHGLYEIRATSGVGTGITVNNSAAANAASRHNVVPPFLVTNYIIRAVADAPRSGLAYGSTPPIVTALPANPQFGDVVTYIADATNGVAWDLQYDATGTYPWKFVGGSPLTASAVGTYSSPATGSTSNYVNSGLSGSPTITAPLAGDYITRVNANAKTSNSSPAPGVFISYASAAPASWDASDSLAGGGAATSYVLGAQKRGTVTAASQAIALVWTNANIGGTASFYSIYMSATPIRVKAA